MSERKLVQVEKRRNPADHPQGRILARQAPPRARVPDGDYDGLCSGASRPARGGEGIEQSVYLPAPRVVLPLYCNLPTDGIIQPTSKLGLMLAVLGIDPAEPLRDDTFTGRWCRVRVTQTKHTVRYDAVIGRRTRVALPEALWWSKVDEVLAAIAEPESAPSSSE